MIGLLEADRKDATVADEKVYKRITGSREDEATVTVEAIDYHRNGVTGAGFYVVKFNDSANGPMVGIVFDEGTAETGRCAILQLEQLAAGDIGFGTNSWRGDYWEPALRVAIKEWRVAERYESGIPYLVQGGKVEIV